MKDLIIVNSYTPDSNRLKILENFLKELNIKKEFDIMVVSHSQVPEYIFEYIDYFIYEKSNIVLEDIKYKYPMEYSTDKWKVVTTEARTFNHFIAAYRLFYLGLINSKKLNYKKVHFVEYDTTIKNLNFFKNNSNLLENFSLVYYEINTSPFLISFPMSFNVEKLKDYWFDYNEDNIYEYLEKNNYKTIETYLKKLINNQSECFAESSDKIKESDVQINIYSSAPDLNWVCPIIRDDKIVLFVKNMSDDIFNIKYIINNEETIHNKTIKVNHWYFFDLCLFDDIKTLQIIKDNKNIVNYDFNLLDKFLYKEKNNFTNL